MQTPYNHRLTSLLTFRVVTHYQQPHNCTAAGSDSSDPSAAFTFSWSIVHRPSTSNAALDDVALQNPTLGAVDVWGNYLLFLIVTNSATGQTSETDPLCASKRLSQYVFKVKS